MQCEDLGPVHDSLVHAKYCWHFYVCLLNSPGLFGACVCLCGDSQVVIVVKNPPTNSGDVGVMGLILGWEDPLEEGMAIHSNIFVWRIPLDRGAWQATVHNVTMSQT